MAALHSFRHTVGFSLIASTALLSLSLLVGCQSQKSMVGDLPSPNFSAPLAPQPAPPPRLAAVTPRPQPAPPPHIQQPAPKATAGAIPREWIPPVPPRSWQAIVIHHSATPAGGAARFDREHREKGWDELGYDFVVGNGTDTADGQIEVGSRWVKQKVGAHAKTPDNWYNEHGIGICLVGNFDGDRPTAAQMRSTARLVAYMMKTYHIPADHVIGHGDTKPTDCPGRYMHVAEVRRMATQMLLAEGTSVDAGNTRTASTATELLIDR
jgi:hypothetical protein